MRLRKERESRLQVMKEQAQNRRSPKRLEPKNMIVSQRSPIELQIMSGSQFSFAISTVCKVTTEGEKGEAMYNR